MLYSFLAKSKMLFACASVACTFVLFPPLQLRAQDSPTQADTDKIERQRAFELYNQAHYTDAAPLLEKLRQRNPDDIGILSRLGYSLYVSTAAIKDAETKRQAVARAREILLRSQSLGDNSPLTATVLEATANNATGAISFSTKKEVDKAMKDGEAAYAQGDAAKALAAYQRAMKLDPKLYEAPLFAGDAYFLLKQPDKAGEMYARAIAINPDRETAYRYWGDILTKQGKMAEAREKVIEGYLAEPYNRLAVAGFVQWANANNIRPGHPRIDIPSNISQTGNNQTTITIDENILKGGDTDGSSAWMIYGVSRASWRTDNLAKFKKVYPNEQIYRHTLAEEAEALYLVAENVKAQINGKGSKQLNPSLQNLLRLDKDGLLEAYILLVRPDAGIVQDYAAYRKAHKDLLRRYVVEYVLTGGGK